MTEVTEPVVEAEGGNSGWTPPATQDELNRIIADRITREKAKYADYADLKTKASEFDKLADAQKTETQRALERAEAAERALAESQSAALRLSVIARHGIPAEYQEFVSGGSEDELEARATKVKAMFATAGQTNLIVPAEGSTPALALNGDGIESALKNALGIA